MRSAQETLLNLFVSAKHGEPHVFTRQQMSFEKVIKDQIDQEELVVMHLAFEQGENEERGLMLFCALAQTDVVEETFEHLLTAVFRMGMEYQQRLQNK